MRVYDLFEGKGEGEWKNGLSAFAVCSNDKAMVEVVYSEPYHT